MSKDSKKDTQNDSQSNDDLKSINAEDYDVKNFSLGEMYNTGASAAQDYMFPRYKYPTKQKGSNVENYGERCIVITKPMVLEKGGIPSRNEKWRPTDAECLYIAVPWIPEDEGSNELFTKVLEPTDDKLDKEINEKENKDNFAYKLDKDKSKIGLKKLKYRRLVTEVDPNFNAHDDDDDENKNESDSGKKKWKRVKVKIATVWDEKAKVDDPKKIKTKVFLKDAHGNPKSEPENIESLDDLRELCPWKCTVQFALEFSKFWVMRAPDDDKKKRCGLQVKCIQMFILDRPTKQGTASLGVNVFGGKKKEDNVNDAKDNNSDDSDNDKSDNDSDNKSDDSDKKETKKEDKKEVKKETKKDKKETKKDKKKVESESESSDDSESESSSSDSDSDDSDSDKKTKQKKDSNDKKSKKK